MLFAYHRCLSRIPIQRVIFTGAIASFFTVFILYIALTKSNTPHVQNNKDILVENKNYKMMIFRDDVSIVQKSDETQIETLWNDDDEEIIEDFDSEDYGSFLDIQQKFEALSEDKIKYVDNEMTQRRQHVKNVCKDFKINETGDVNAHEFLINEEHHLIWCNIFKAASTSWMYNFNLMAGFSEQEAAESSQPQAMARERYPRPSVEELRNASVNSTSMIIVRHPFERLSSAYRDKMQNALPFTMYSNLAEKIIMEYRIKDSSDSDDSLLFPPWPTFEEFIRYILDEAAYGKTMDIHWAPYTSFCTPCHYDFDVIAKFETIEDDQKYLIQKAGLENIITPQWRNSGGSKQGDRRLSSSDLKYVHYSQLEPEQITQLYEIYRYDFLLFDYSIDDYYQITMDAIYDDYFDYWDDVNAISI